MTIVKVDEQTYINVDRMTYVQPKRRRLIVHFAVGGGDLAGPDCRVTLEPEPSLRFLQWLDTHSQTA
ncbi:MAG: hypothetical protein JW993_16235 [Sedimentisphaerales bacterium]|nr:hypothetical protein [Sedimentisphaerales bacterium]